MQKDNSNTVLVIVIILFVAAAVLYWQAGMPYYTAPVPSPTSMASIIPTLTTAPATAVPSSTPTPSPSPTPSSVAPSPAISPSPIIPQKTTDGTISFLYPTDEFALAVTPEQILIKSYIPPCSEGFNYCVYYAGLSYKKTNFESAGLRIQKTDMATSKTCLNTPPSGYEKSKPASTKSEDNYSSSVFTEIGDAAAGHFATGSLYRLFVKNNSSCYEFETRVGQTQFENYPTGSIKEFNDDDLATVEGKLHGILDQISIPSGEKELFPEVK